MNIILCVKTTVRPRRFHGWMTIDNYESERGPPRIIEICILQQSSAPCILDEETQPVCLRGIITITCLVKAKSIFKVATLFSYWIVPCSLLLIVKKENRSRNET